MNSGQACRPCRGSCSPIPVMDCFGDLPGTKSSYPRPPQSLNPFAARPTCRIAVAVVIVARPDTVSDGALPPLKLAFPSSTPNSNRTIRTDLCLKHGNYACDRQVNCRRNASGNGRFHYSNQGHKSTFPGNGGTTYAINQVGASIQPARQTPCAPGRAASAAPPAMKYRPTFTGYTNPSTRQHSAL